MELDHRESRVGWMNSPAASNAAVIGAHHSTLIKHPDHHGLVPEDLGRTL
jgi:hypothetical protein